MEFEHDGVRLGFDDWGSPSPEAPPVLFLHGLGDARSTWSRFVEPILDHRRVVTLDFRGHGRSDHPGAYRLEDYVGDAITLLDVVVQEPVIAVGHSLGGVVAFTMAQTRPEMVTGLMLEDPPLYPETRQAAGPFFSLLQGITRELQSRRAPIKEYEAFITAAPSGNGRESMAEVLGVERARSLAESLASLDPDIFSLVIEGDGFTNVQPQHPVSCPLLVLRADPALLSAFSEEDEGRFLTSQPEARVIQIAAASHLIHDEQPRRFALELEGFLLSLNRNTTPQHS